jgi:hypothetical protein
MADDSWMLPDVGAVEHSTMRRSVAIPKCSGLRVVPYMLTTYSVTRTPSRLMLRCAFRAWSGSNVQSTRVTPRAASVLALELFELTSDAHFARLSEDAEHVRPMHDLAVSDAGEAEHEANEGVGGERTDHEAADVGRRLEQGRRNRSSKSAPQIAFCNATHASKSSSDSS